ncbi:MAG: PEP-CTERM sorting domain-containing protein [Verrucomicrobiota bacterium]
MTTESFAAWSVFSLPNLSNPFGAVAIDHLSDGRAVFAESGNFHAQTAWDMPGFSPYTGNPQTGLDPSFIAFFNDTTGVAGEGTFGASDLQTFNPSMVGAPGFANIGVSLQNYHGVFRDASSLFVGGADTGAGNDRHGIRYVTLDGSTNVIVIDDVSQFSTGFDIDGAGNLYVGDNDDGSVYRFTASQLNGAITSGVPLTVGDGTFIHDFGDGGNIGTLAVDGTGRIWGAGFLQNGVKVFNPAISQEFSFIPLQTNANYYVSAFSRGGEDYISFINQEDPFSGNSAQFYGFDLAANHAVPEPQTFGLLGLAGLILFLRRKKSH